MSAQRRAHRGEHTYESTEESTHRKGHTEESIHIKAQEEHTFESTQRRAHIYVKADTYDSTPRPKHTWTGHKSHFMQIYRKNAGPKARKRHFVLTLTGKKPHTTPPTSNKNQAFYSYRKNSFSVATLFHCLENNPNRRFRTLQNMKQVSLLVKSFLSIYFLFTFW